MNLYELIFIALLIIIMIVILLIYDVINIIKKIKSKTSIEDKKSFKCLDCENDEFYNGPGGGSFGNIKCTSCGAEYNNLGPFGFERIN